MESISAFNNSVVAQMLNVEGVLPKALIVPRSASKRGRLSTCDTADCQSAIRGRFLSELQVVQFHEWDSRSSSFHEQISATRPRDMTLLPLLLETVYGCRAR